jgi:DNA-binding transcriptional regulator YiaG
VTSLEFRAAIETLGMTQGQTATFLGVALRTVSGWAIGQYPIPDAVAMLLHVMIERRIAAADIQATIR